MVNKLEFAYVFIFLNKKDYRIVDASFDSIVELQWTQRSLLSQLSQKIREFFDFTDQWNHSLKFQVPSIGKILIV